MCGRFLLITSTGELIDRFGFFSPLTLVPRYNNAPTQSTAVARLSTDGSDIVLDMLRWGLIPSWAKEAKIGARMINARSETAAGKPSFRRSFQQRRCLIPADGFYEWKKQSHGKQPYCIRTIDQSPFAFAGLWETWTDSTNEIIESFTILTIHANDLISQLHERMPVILAQEHFEQWLDPQEKDVAKLQKLLQPYPSEQMSMFAVQKRVNSPRNDDPLCIEPLSPEIDYE